MHIVIDSCVVITWLQVNQMTPAQAAAVGAVMSSKSTAPQKTPGTLLRKACHPVAIFSFVQLGWVVSVCLNYCSIQCRMDEKGGGWVTWLEAQEPLVFHIIRCCIAIA